MTNPSRTNKTKYLYFFIFIYKTNKIINQNEQIKNKINK